MNILRAAMLAMRRAAEGLSVQPDLALVDGNCDPRLGFATQTIVGGDGRSASIAAASILAKVARDRYMKELDQKYPAVPVRASTRATAPGCHYEMLRTSTAPAPVHRRTFLKKLLQMDGDDAAARDAGGGVRREEARRRTGYEILARNWRSGRHEIDLILQKDGGHRLRRGQDPRAKRAVPPRPRASPGRSGRRIALAAVAYLRERGIYNTGAVQPRFDLFEVVTERPTARDVVTRWAHLAGAYDTGDLDVFI